MTLTLLLAACGPGQADPDGSSDAGDITTNHSNGGGSSTSDTPTEAGSGDPGGGPTNGMTASGEPTTSGASASESVSGSTSSGSTSSGDTSTGDTSTDTTSTGDVSTGEPDGARIVGLAFDSATLLWDTVELDLDTGELIVLATLPPSIASISQGTGTFDPASNRIFQITGANQLLALDAATGAFISATPLTPAELANVGNLQINNAGELVGVVFGPVTQTVEIDPDTGVVTPLAELPNGIGGISQGTGAFDPATDRVFELTGDGGLLVIDAATGVVVEHFALISGKRPLELAVNNAGELVGIANANFPEPWTTVRVDPLTGDATVLDILQGTVSFAQGQLVHDPAGDHMFTLTGEGTVVEIDASTGELLANTMIVPGGHVGLFNPEVVP